MTSEHPDPEVPEDVASDEEGAPQAPSSEAPSTDEADAPAGEEQAEPTVEQQLAERTADLQRLQAEYVNYRKRVERDRALARQQGEANVLRSMLTVLDDLGRAEEHGELVGGFKAVADQVKQTLKNHRLEAFGAEGDVFDPRLHEALFQAGESAEITQTTVQSVVRTGYRVGDEVLRHAEVGVLQPASPEAESGADS